MHAHDSSLDMHVSTLCDQNYTSCDLENLSTNSDTYHLYYLSAHGYYLAILPCMENDEHKKGRFG